MILILNRINKVIICNKIFFQFFSNKEIIQRFLEKLSYLVF